MSTFPPTPGMINSLDPNAPVDPNFVYGGDDWFRFIQDVLKNKQFPKSEDGSNNGWDIALTVKASEVNSLSGISAANTVEQRLATLEAAQFPTGNVTFLTFFQASAPTGWTQSAAHDNKMLRVVSGSGGGSGGQHSPIMMDKIPPHSHPFTGDAVPNHTHRGEYSLGSGSNSIMGVQRDQVPSSSVDGIMDGAGGHTPSGTVENNTGVNAINWEPLYVDVIMASKD